MDFFTIPSITFGVLYCFFVIVHDRRRILHFNVTRHPASLWITQQLREAFPYESPCKYLISDRDIKFGDQVTEAVAALDLAVVNTSFRSPWQNGVAERWGGKLPPRLVRSRDSVNERHLKRLLSGYVRYYHELILAYKRTRIVID